MTNLKEVVKAMRKAYQGGREAMAGALGMSVTQLTTSTRRTAVVSSKYLSLKRWKTFQHVVTG